MAEKKPKINSVKPSAEAYKVLYDTKNARKTRPGDEGPPYADIIDEWRAAAGAVPESYQIHVCPLCESKTYIGCEHVRKNQVPDSVPETEQRLQSVKKGAYSKPDPITEAAVTPDVRPWIEMLLGILNSKDPDAPESIQSNLRSFYRLVGGDPDALIEKEGIRRAGDREGDVGVVGVARVDPDHDKHPRKKAG